MSPNPPFGQDPEDKKNIVLPEGGSSEGTLPEKAGAQEAAPEELNAEELKSEEIVPEKVIAGQISDEQITLSYQGLSVTPADLQQKAVMARMRRRILWICLLFIALFSIISFRLVWVMAINPRMPPPSIADIPPVLSQTLPVAAGERAPILSRNGEIMAVSLPSAYIFADPQQIIDPALVARDIARIIPTIDTAFLTEELADKHLQFAYVARQVTAEQEIAVNDLGIPGIYFQSTEKRYYPLGPVAAHILGGVNINQQGIAGTELYFNQRLLADPLKPLHLTISIPVEGVLYNVLKKTVRKFRAYGGCAIVMNVHNGELVGMASAPSYSADNFYTATPNEKFDRCVSAVYEPGSVMKLQTVGMAVQDGLINIWDRFNTTHPLHIDQFVIRDYEPVHRWLYLPEIIAYSSNIGAARIALIVGKKRQIAFLKKMGIFSPEPVQLPGVAETLYHPFNQWGKATVMTVAFGNGIAPTPLYMATATAALVNGGILYKPTLVMPQPGTVISGVRVVSPRTSRIVRQLMRDVVVYGTGPYAAVKGYYVGGKTGTSQIVADGVYLHHSNISSFMAAFPINRPDYLVYVTIDDPRGNAQTHWFSTGGYVAAPAVGQIISGIGPILGVVPYTAQQIKQINKHFAIPLHPKPPPGSIVLGPGNPYPPGAADAPPDLHQGTVAPDATQGIFTAPVSKPTGVGQ